MDAQQQVFLRKEQIPFTMVANAIIFDSRISSKAKFYYVYLSSKPDAWKFHTNCIVKEIKEGRDAFYNGLKELIEFGYLERQQIKENGKFKHTDYILKIPYTENTDTEKPYTENTDYNNKDLNKNDKSNKDIKDTASGSPLSQFEEFWNEYGKKVKKPKAEESYKHALKTKDTTFQSIMKGVKKYNEYLNVAIWLERADPTTWLNGQRWNDDYDDLIKQEYKKNGKTPPIQQKSPEKQQEEVRMKEDAQKKREGVLRFLNDNETEFMNHIKESLKTDYFTNPLHHFWINDLVFCYRDKVAYLGFTQQKHIDAVERNFTKIEQIIVRALSVCDELKAEKIELKLID